MRVLCTGDIHIGRRSTRLPSNVDPRNLSCASAWGGIVDYAIGQQVEVVALSGDLVDQANCFYESLGPLERGLRRLQAAGITAVAVAGNHDYGVLPELARSLPPQCLRLLGVGGRWERTTVTGKDGAKLHVDGWSFPTKHVRENPLDLYTLPAATDAPVLGLLHTDLDAPGSLYAPVSTADLNAHHVTLWVLGHIHASRLHETAGKPTVLYPGSPQPMDPGEGGAHGVWIVDLTPGAPVRPRRVPVATVRYEVLDVDVSGVTDLAAARVIILERIRAAAEMMVPGSGPLRHLSLRVRLTGRSRVHRELERDGRAMCADLELDVQGVSVYAERVDVTTRPERDLDHIGRGTDAASFLARLIQDLDRASSPEHGSEDALAGYDELLRALEPIPGILQTAKPYRSLAPDAGEFDRHVMHDALAHQANLLLDELLSQKEQIA